MRNGFIFVLTLLLSLLPISAQETLVIACAQGSASEALIPLVRAIYDEMQVAVNIRLLPAQRALMMADKGEVDGDIGRASGSLDCCHNLMFTTEPISIVELKAWVRNGSTITLKSPADLGPLKVGYVRGLKLAENLCIHEHIESQTVNNFDLLIKMLSAGRFDVALSAVGNPALSEKVIQLPVTLATAKSYHVLNKKHVRLAVCFDSVLKKMKADGRFVRLTAKNGGDGAEAH